MIGNGVLHPTYSALPAYGRRGTLGLGTFIGVGYITVSLDKSAVLLPYDCAAGLIPLHLKLLPHHAMQYAAPYNSLQAALSSVLDCLITGCNSAGPLATKPDFPTPILAGIAT